MTGGRLEGELLGYGRNFGRGAARSLEEGWKLLGDGRKVGRGAARSLEEGWKGSC